MRPQANQIARTTRDEISLLRRAQSLILRMEHAGGDALTGAACPTCGAASRDSHAEDCELADWLSDAWEILT